MKSAKMFILEKYTNSTAGYFQLTSKPIQCVGDDSRKQKDPHSFSLYLDGQAQVLSH
jgi:hypothetical protein